MSAYEYNALDGRGRTRRGVLEGDTARQVRQRLRELGLTPLEVTEVERRESSSQRARPFGHRLGPTDLALVTRQLATLTQSALPLEEALRTVAQQTEKRRARAILLAVRARVVEGHSLAEALGDFPHSFSELYRATVAAGEQSGHLDVVLERLADYTEQRQAMRARIQLALFYPALLTLMAILVTGGLMVYVVPQVVQVFDNLGQQLPWLTRTLISVSDGLRASGLFILAAVLATALLAPYLLRVPRIRWALHVAVLKLPLAARLTRGLNTARFARTFSILTASGVAVLESLRISAQVLANLPMRQAVEVATQRVREGTSLYSALASSRLFPPMTLSLIASGEASGNLESMLERAAINQEREVETLISALLGLFEPLLILLMGAIVLVIVLAILLPIFDLNQLVR